jgi:hypothetical protein
MIERRGMPVDGRMAGCADRAECAVVRVLFRMTVGARRAGVVKRERRVTGGALEHRVLAEHGERDEAVIEPQRRIPRELGVAGLAARAKLASVRILAVARRALAAEVGRNAGRVAARAREVSVRSR